MVWSTPLILAIVPLTSLIVVKLVSWPLIPLVVRLEILIVPSGIPLVWWHIRIPLVTLVPIAPIGLISLISVIPVIQPFLIFS